MKQNSSIPDKTPHLLKPVDIKSIFILLFAFLLLATGLTLSILNNLGIIGRIDPTLVSTFEAQGKVTGIQVEGKYAYLTYNLFEDGTIEVPLETGLQISDTSLSTEPEPIISYITPMGADCLSVSGNYAFVGGRGLQILDISDKEFPAFISSYPLDVVDTCIIVEKDYIYLAGYDPGSDCSKLHIVNISDKTHPVVESIIEIGGMVRDIDLKDGFVYIASGGNGLVIIDIIDKAAPEPTSAMDMPMISGVSIRGNTAYSIGLDFKVIDVSDKLNPHILGTCGIPGTGYDIYADESYAYIINGNSYSGEDGAAIFQIIDIEDSSNPQIRKSCTMDISRLEPLGTYITGNYAYITGSGNTIPILKLKY
jgi:hypothetical protein